MKQPQITRLKLIHGTIERDGRLNVGQICDEFNISKPQASLDIRNYRALCPDNIKYDDKNKHYFKTPEFKDMPDLEAKKSLVHQSVTVRFEDYNIVKNAGVSHVEVYRAGIVAMGFMDE